MAVVALSLSTGTLRRAMEPMAVVINFFHGEKQKATEPPPAAPPAKKAKSKAKSKSRAARPPAPSVTADPLELLALPHDAARPAGEDVMPPAALS